MHPLYPVFHERFRYENGVLFIKKAGQWKGKVGDRAGTAGGRDKKRIVIQVMGQRFFAHQVIWIMFHEDLPPAPLTIDHEDLNPLNNRIENLRVASPTEQQANSLLQSNNTSGFKGVSYNPNKNKGKPFRAVCKNKHIGWFKTAEEAAEAYDAETVKLFGSFAKTNKELQ